MNERNDEKVVDITPLKDGSYSITFPDTPQLDVKVVLVRRSMLEVLAYAYGDFTLPVVKLFLKLDFYRNSVEVVDCYGSGSGNRFHRMGLGALAINVAIQFLKGTCDPAVEFHGHIFDAGDADLPDTERVKRQEDRKAFWRKFGFGITEPDLKGEEHLCGTLGDLHVSDEGKVLGVHPRCFDIAAMSYTSPQEENCDSFGRHP